MNLSEDGPGHQALHIHLGRCYPVGTWAGRMTRAHIMAGEVPRHSVCGDRLDALHKGTA
jgi:hypothetical protein